MLVNLSIDTVVGAIPIVGDFFDVAYKANIKNMQIYRESMSGTRAPLKDWAFIAFVSVILLLIVLLPLLGLVYVLQQLTSALPQ
jgi:hypothetical protein